MSDSGRLMKTTKVFGIGFHKTGTSSLGFALRTLGYSVTGPNNTRHRKIPDSDALWASVRDLIDQFDAFQDNPWPLLFKELYAHSPESKFVLTIRPSEDWIRSMVNYFGSRTSSMREWIYGVGGPLGHESEYIERYERHNRDVLKFFSDKTSSLLVMNFSAGDGWTKLCGFLGEARIPSRPFPHWNARLSGGTKTVSNSGSGT